MRLVKNIYVNCSDFIEDWVKICLPAKSKVISELGDSAFEDQCGRCERVYKHMLDR